MKDIDRMFFLPMSDIEFNPDSPRSGAKHEAEQRFAESLHERYNEITVTEFKRLIDYAGVALLFASGVGIELWDMDRASFTSMDKKPFNIDEIVFKGYRPGGSKTLSFEITNPYIINQVYNLLKNFFDYLPVKDEKHTKKKRPSAEIIKLVGTEIFNALRNKNISKWTAESILGQIMGFYRMSLKVDEPTMTEQEYITFRERHHKKPTYISYCQDVGKRCHN